MKYILIQIISLLVLAQTLISMPLKMSKEDIIRYTPEWKGERFSDGRPKVPDGIIERMKNIDIEAAWVVLRNEGYDYQCEGGWRCEESQSVFSWH